MSAARIQRIAPGIQSLFRASPTDTSYSRLHQSCSLAAIVGFSPFSCRPSSVASPALSQTPAASSPLSESRTAVAGVVRQSRDSDRIVHSLSPCISVAARRDSRFSATQSVPASQAVVSTCTRSFAAAAAFGMAAPKEISSNKMFGGVNKRYEHESATLGCTMKFSIYFPPAATSSRVPVIYWLSGLTCTDENFIQKSFAQKYASEHGVALIVPDTSPRGLKVEGESDSWDFGVGAGFYVNATVPKWKNWQMYDYVTEELHRILSAHYTNLDMQRCSLMGHSMGGHGALIIFFRNSTKYKSVSAFAPICNPTECAWGQKAFSGYLGDDKAAWEEYDATALVKQYPGPKVDILIDQGDSDKFYHEKQLLPENFQKACTEAGVPLTLRFQGGYDHSYFFIASFIGDHIKHHAKALKA